MKTDVKIENLSPEEMEQFQALVDKANKPKRKMPNVGDRLYYIDLCGIIRPYIWQATEDDWIAFEYGGIYFTQEDAEAAREHEDVERLLRRYAKEHNDKIEWGGDYFNFYIYYDFKSDTLYFENCRFYKTNNIYFSSQKIAEAAIKEIGEERVTRFYRGY